MTRSRTSGTQIVPASSSPVPSSETADQLWDDEIQARLEECDSVVRAGLEHFWRVGDLWCRLREHPERFGGRSESDLSAALRRGREEGAYGLRTLQMYGQFRNTYEEGEIPRLVEQGISFHAIANFVLPVRKPEHRRQIEDKIASGASEVVLRDLKERLRDREAKAVREKAEVSAPASKRRLPTRELGRTEKAAQEMSLALDDFLAALTEFRDLDDQEKKILEPQVRTTQKSLKGLRDRLEKLIGRF